MGWRCTVSSALIKPFQCRKGLAYKPRDPELHNNLGSSFYLKGEFSSALTAFERASQANPQEPRFWRNQLMILKEQGRLEDAEARLAQALRVLPNNASLKNEALSLERKPPASASELRLSAPYRIQAERGADADVQALKVALHREAKGAITAL